MNQVRPDDENYRHRPFPAYKRRQGAQFSAAMSYCVESLFEQDIRLHFMQIKYQLQ